MTCISGQVEIMIKPFLIISALSGLTAVGMGAFAAHGLKGKIAPELLNAFQTGVHYQIYHTLALMLVLLLSLHFPDSRELRWTCFAFIFGVILFSGSLYLLALGGPRWLGPVTPLGGGSLMIGWACLLLAAWRLSE